MSVEVQVVVEECKAMIRAMAESDLKSPLLTVEKQVEALWQSDYRFAAAMRALGLLKDQVVCDEKLGPGQRRHIVSMSKRESCLALTFWKMAQWKEKFIVQQLHRKSMRGMEVKEPLKGDDEIAVAGAVVPEIGEEEAEKKEETPTAQASEPFGSVHSSEQ